ncbi:uncharacterized protein LOC116841687 [Odontomachus brunneus]|uniref:uncharacterized protein LOC116841687 n=1 Tax=Odontomachus brunneus TaxID=486640 RepID=UPI0013F2A7A0|nr:uncharacterized protein LOC116841687 [Odontomachus brunneus]
MRVGLKTSLSNFLKRVREGTNVELPDLPRTRSYPRACSSDPLYSTLMKGKSATARKVLGKDLGSSSNDNGLLSKWQKVDGNLAQNRREEKAKQEPFARVANRSQTKHDSHELGKMSELPLPQNNLDHITEKKTIATQRRETGAKKPYYG